MNRISEVVELIKDVDRLKLINRASYVGDASRRENSAEHSWHLAFSLLAFASELEPTLDIHKALKMALIHDICEIDAGDTPAYTSARTDQHEAEQNSMTRLASSGLRIGVEVNELWLEYENQETLESKWVRVMDRLLPFISNLMTEGRLWKEKSITKSQVLSFNKQVNEYVPEIYVWMVEQIEESARKGWLIDA